MKVYLDAKDLIGILQVGNPCTANQFAQYLVQHGHQLAVSYYPIMEISAPLLYPSSQTNVMKLLNDLAEMLIAYLHADIRGLELREALDAFSSRREYQHVLPFVKRFDEALDLSEARNVSIHKLFFVGNSMGSLYVGRTAGFGSLCQIDEGVCCSR
jgi:hypothetical protein